MDNSWIKISRSIQNHWVYNNPDHFKAWVCILINTNFKEHKTMINGELISCGRGQCIYSLDTWMKKFGKNWTKQKVRTFFKNLQKDGMIEIEGLTKTTRLTVCNYSSYQDQEHTNNTDLTFKQHSPNTDLTPREEGKNDKEGKEVLSELLDFWNKTIPLKKYSPRKKAPLESKLQTRIKSNSNFVKEFKEACLQKLDSFALENSWFCFQWVLKSDDNFAKWKNGNYSVKEKEVVTDFNSPDFDVISYTNKVLDSCRVGE